MDSLLVYLLSNEGVICAVYLLESKDPGKRDVTLFGSSCNLITFLYSYKILMCHQYFWFVFVAKEDCRFKCVYTAQKYFFNYCF